MPLFPHRKPSPHLCPFALLHPQCTEQGDDSFDICEAHLFTECRDHDQSHHFIRQPRPFADFDDYVQETPLLKAEDLKQERKQHELVVMTLACILLHAKS